RAGRSSPRTRARRWCGACPGRWSPPVSPTRSPRCRRSRSGSSGGASSAQRGRPRGGPGSGRRGTSPRRPGVPPRACGVVLEPERHYLLDGRLQRVALRLGFRSVDEFVRAACAPGAGQNLTDPLLDAITTHETSFFRDPAFWRTLEEQILPPLVQTGRPLSIWSAACATGQEALSLAMLLAERWPAAFDSVRILATDVSGDTIARARASTYNVVEVNRGLEPERLVRHFDVVPRGFRAKAALRERIVYMVHNLLGAAPYPS